MKADVNYDVADGTLVRFQGQYAFAYNWYKRRGPFSVFNTGWPGRYKVRTSSGETWKNVRRESFEIVELT